MKYWVAKNAFIFMKEIEVPTTRVVLTLFECDVVLLVGANRYGSKIAESGHVPCRER